LPTENPTQSPTPLPTENPTQMLTSLPTGNPTKNRTSLPAENPTQSPTPLPTQSPTQSPTPLPTQNPTQNITTLPNIAVVETIQPTNPILPASEIPITRRPTVQPTIAPSSSAPVVFDLAREDDLEAGVTLTPTKSLEEASEFFAHDVAVNAEERENDDDYLDGEDNEGEAPNGKEEDAEFGGFDDDGLDVTNDKVQDEGLEVLDDDDLDVLEVDTGDLDTLEVATSTEDLNDVDETENVDKDESTFTDDFEQFSFTEEDLQGLKGVNGAANLQFSLWFPDHHVSDLDIAWVENEVLTGLKQLFCDLDTPLDNDNMCVLHDDVLKLETAQISITRQAPLPTRERSELDYTILLPPYVAHLDERYRSNDGGDSWTTWQVVWEIYQFGSPLLQQAISSSGSGLETTDLIKAGVREIQQLISAALDANIRSGKFDAVLKAHVKDVPVASSVVNEELKTFVFLAWDDLESDVKPSITSEGGSSDSTRNTTITVIVILVACVIIVAAAGYLHIFKPRSPKAEWKKEREKHIVDAIERENERDDLSQKIPQTVNVSTFRNRRLEGGSIDGSRGQITTQLDLEDVVSMSSAPSTIFSVLSMPMPSTYSVMGLEEPDEKIDEDESSLAPTWSVAGESVQNDASMGPNIKSDSLHLSALQVPT